MTESAAPSSKKRVVFSILFLVGLAMVFVTTAGPLSGPAMSWNEAGAGLVPGALLLVVGHLLHTRALARQQAHAKALRWWIITTVLLLGLGAALVLGGMDKKESAESRLRDARARASSYAYGGGYGGGYGGYDSTSSIERDVDHYETAVNVGWGVLAVSLLFAVGTVLALRRSRAAGG